MNKSTLHVSLAIIFILALATLLSLPTVEASGKCYAELGVGAVYSSTNTRNDWVGDSPQGRVSGGCDWSVYSWVVPNTFIIEHVSNVTSGAPFNDRPESDFNYVGIGWRRTFITW